MPAGLVIAGVTRDSLKAGRLRVFVDGEEVTAQCFAADDRYGWAGLLAGERPHIAWVPTHGQVVAREIRTGHVQVWLERKDGRYRRALRAQR